MLSLSGFELYSRWVPLIAEVDYSKRFLLEKLGRSRDEKTFFVFLLNQR